MTRRERLERRAERLEEWADKRTERASATLASHERYRGDHAFNFQPGYIPERARVIKQAHRAFESLDKAHEMSGRAEGIRGALASSIYSDDEDAPEALRARIASLEAERERWKAYNASCKRGAPDETLLDERQRGTLESLHRHVPYQLGRKGEVSYTNLSANIRRNRERLEGLERDAATREAGGRGHGRPMLARFASGCAGCGEPIEKGSPIVYYRLTREAVHAACAEERARAAAQGIPTVEEVAR